MGNGLESKFRTRGKGGFRLPQEEIDKIIEEYKPCNANTSEIARRSKHNRATVRKYLREAGLEIRRKGGSLIQEEIDKVIKLNQVCDENAYEAVRQSGHCFRTIHGIWKKAQLKSKGNSRYKNYGGPLGYYLAHPEKYFGLSRFELFKVDQGMYRALLRRDEIDEAIPEIGNQGRHSLSQEKIDEIVVAYKEGERIISRIAERVAVSHPSVKKYLALAGFNVKGEDRMLKRKGEL